MLSQKIKVVLNSVSLSLLITNPLYAAAVFDPSTVPLFNIAPYVVSNSNVSEGGAKAYRPWFENGSWQGDIIQYDISSTGDKTTTVDYTVQPPTTPTTPGSNWSARIKFDAAVGSAPTTYWDTGREIIFHDGTNQKAFRHANLSAPQKIALSSNNLDYIRGDQSRETDQTNGTLRKRFNLLGDIIHSNPVYVAAPDSRFTGLPGYGAFKAAKANRAARVYVGANDGMLHAFNADTGSEEWAYVPSMLINNLYKLTQWPSSHIYTVDGQLSEGDMDFDNAADTYSWRSILAGGLGSGGKGFFILDITNPTLSAEESTDTTVDKKILKELDGSDADIGYIYGKAQIARLPDVHSDEWVVMTGNGYGSTSGLAKLILIDKDGNVDKYLTDGTTGNGLSAPTLVDVGNDFDVDIAYAGDLKGNLWKFDLTDATRPNATLLYPSTVNANADKPITTAPDVRRHPSGGYLVYFATGSLLSKADSISTAAQSVYAIWDGAPAGNTTLLTQTLSTETHSYTNNAGTPDDLTDDTTVTKTVRTSTNEVMDWATYKGWQVDLNISGERVVSGITIRADRLQFVSHNPLSGDHGDAWLLQLNYLNGGTGANVFLDLNIDGYLNSDDKANNKIPLGIQLGYGSFSEPSIIRVSGSRDNMYINGLFLEYTEGCTVNCPSGFQGGHIDVETDGPAAAATATAVSDSYCYEDGNRAAGIPVDSNGDALASPYTGAAVRSGGDFVTRRGHDDYNGGPGNVGRRTSVDGYGGEVDGHIHEYDKEHGLVYVDAVNLEPLCNQPKASGRFTNEKQNLARITEYISDYDKKFFVIMANADLSSGSTFQLGAKSWNGLVYQKMIHQKLKAWKAAGANTSMDAAVSTSFAAMMVDDAGDSLLYSINTMLAAGSNTGTFRHSFNDRALADGGLMGNIPQCVGPDPEENISNNSDGSNTTTDTGRWRGGALVTQVIAVTEYLADTTTVVEQRPTDLAEFKNIEGIDVYLKEDLLDETVSPAVAGTDGVREDPTYGGLRARYRTGGATNGSIINNPAFLYEIDLFWHYSKTGVRSQDVCYGQNGYETRLATKIGEYSTETVLAQLTEKQTELAAAQASLDACIRRCWRKQRTVNRLTQEIAELQSALSDDSVVNTGLVSLPEDPNIPVTPSLGPNFQTGRRTWVDL